MRALVIFLIVVSGAYAQNGATLVIRSDQRAQFSAWLWPGGKHATSDGQGRVLFTELSAGKYRVEIVASGYAVKDTAISLLAGEHRVLEVILMKLAATLAEVLVETENYSISNKYTREDLEKSAAPSLAEFLQTEAGLDVRSDGIVGSVKTARIGGSNPNQVLVLMDGRRMQDAGSGAADLASIPLDWVERVEVYCGSRTDLGGEGIGGIIQIVTRNPREETSLSAQATWRETNQRISVSREGSIGVLGGLISYTRLQGPNDFRYKISEDDGAGDLTPNLGKSYRRQNAQVARDQMLVKLADQINDNWKISLTGTMDRVARGMPGYLAPQLTLEGRQNTAQNVVNAHAMRTGQKHDLQVRCSYQHDWKEFSDASPYALVTHAEESSSSMEGEISARSRIKRALIGYGSLFGQETMQGDNLRGEGAERSRWAAWGVWRQMLAESKGWCLSGESGLRAEGFGDDRAILPQTELSVMRSASWTGGLSFGWSKSFRAPDFYALFWQEDQLAGGNSELKPEHSSEWTGTAYLEWPWRNRTRLEINGSNQHVEDLIYWRRTFDNRWKPFNLRAASVRTADVSLSQFLWQERLQIKVAIDWTVAKDATGDRNTGGKYLTFRPLNTQRIGVEYQFRRLSAEVNYRRVSERPVLETNSKWLSGYELVDARMRYALRVRRAEIQPEIGAENLFNENYRIIRFAPMPLREWFLSIKLRTI